MFFLLQRYKIIIKVIITKVIIYAELTFKKYSRPFVGGYIYKCKINYFTTTFFLPIMFIPLLGSFNFLPLRSYIGALMSLSKVMF